MWWSRGFIGGHMQSQGEGPSQEQGDPGSHIIENPAVLSNPGRRGPAGCATASSCSLLPTWGPSQPGEVPESEEPPFSAWKGMVQRYQSEEIARQPQTPVRLRKPGLVALRKRWNLEAGGHRLAYQQVFLGRGHLPHGCSISSSWQ